jgi:hypothetical protein
VPDVTPSSGVLEIRGDLQSFKLHTLIITSPKGVALNASNRGQDDISAPSLAMWLESTGKLNPIWQNKGTFAETTDDPGWSCCQIFKIFCVPYFPFVPFMEGHNAVVLTKIFFRLHCYGWPRDFL